MTETAVVTDEIVQAALAAAIAWQKEARQPLWLSPGEGQVRAMIEAVAPKIAAAGPGRAEAAEAKLAAITRICHRPFLGTVAEERWKSDILAIIASEEADRD